MPTPKSSGAAKSSDFAAGLPQAKPTPVPMPAGPEIPAPTPQLSAPPQQTQPDDGNDFADEPSAPPPVAAPSAMSDADRLELEQLRADRAARAAAAEEAAKSPGMTLDEQMNDDYIHNRGTIQTIARQYHVEVDRVLIAIGQEEMVAVHTVGDMVDASELGPTDAPIQREGQLAKVPYSLN